MDSEGVKAGSGPSVEVRVLSKLMVGEESCLRKPWYEVHHPEETPPPGEMARKLELHRTAHVAQALQSVSRAPFDRNVRIALRDPPLWASVDALRTRVEGTEFYEVVEGSPGEDQVLRVQLELLLLSRRDAQHPPTTGHLLSSHGDRAFREGELDPGLLARTEPFLSEILGGARPRPVPSATCGVCWADCPLAEGRDRSPRVC